MPDLRDADRLAYTALYRLDGGHHDLAPDRADALRDALTELRGWAREASGPWARWRQAAGGVFLLAVLGIGYAAPRLGFDAWYARTFVPAAAGLAAAALLLLVVRLLSPGVTRRALPDPGVVDDAPEEFGALVDRLATTALGLGEGSGTTRWPGIEHVGISAAKAWGIANGGPYVVPGTDRAPAWPGGGSTAARRLHWLTHRMRDQAAASADREPLLRRLSTYDTAHALLGGRWPWRRVTIAGVAVIAPTVMAWVEPASAVMSGVGVLTYLLTIALSGAGSACTQVKSPRRGREDEAVVLQDVRAALVKENAVGAARARELLEGVGATGK